MGEVSFNYQGILASSKSLFNRALIIQSHFPELQVFGESHCDDVKKMQQALLLFEQGETTFDCGAAGTTLRFLMARLSREPGEFYLTGDERLFSRPQQDLIDIFDQLSVKTLWVEKNLLKIESQGWVIPEYLNIDFSKSSQFASAILLNAWKLEKPLKIKRSEQKVSLAYFAMTLNLVKELGMDFEMTKDLLIIPPGQVLNRLEYRVEPDMSSTFTLAAFAAAAGSASFEQFPMTSLQPDARFMRLFKKMGISLEFRGSSLQVTKPEQILPVDCNLSDTPDLFPVLAVLLSMAEGRSVVSGIDHLVYKESNRIENTLSLLKSLDRKASFERGRFIIEGRSEEFKTPSLSFDCDQDHRMAMAAALARKKGADLEIVGGSSVEKSFPDFWKILDQEEETL